MYSLPQSYNQTSKCKRCICPNAYYPLILEFEKWLQDAYLRVLPKSRMGKAIEYTYTLLPRLSRYVVSIR